MMKILGIHDGVGRCFSNGNHMGVEFIKYHSSNILINLLCSDQVDYIVQAFLQKDPTFVPLS